MTEAPPDDPAARIAARLAALTGGRRAAAAMALGLMATAALPPVHALPLLFLAFTGLVWLLDVPATTSRSAIRAGLIDGWFFGFGHFVAAHYWLANALLLDTAQYGWMVPFAVVGLAALLAVFPALAAAAYRVTGARGFAGTVVFAAAWTAAEWLRGHILTGFPWNLIGTVWAVTEPLMQGAALFGLYGLSLITVVVAALPATLAMSSRRWAGTFLAATLLVVGWIAGAARISSEATTVPGVALRLVQPNVPQSLKWDPVLREANFRAAIDLTRSAGFETRTHVIWPETAVPFVITDFAADGPARRAALASVTPQGGLMVTGAPRAERGRDGNVQLWNSIHALDSSGAVVGTYDKHHLVPFGEYVPLRWLIGSLATPAGAIDFSAGPGPAALDLGRLPPASPLICYEAIFPGAVVAAGPRPGWLLNVTNDAWFGLSAGPYQHFVAARFRAVEEGLPLVRVANNGISAVVDPYGRVTARLGLGETGVVDASLPQSIAPTFFSRWGDLATVLLVICLLLTARLRPQF